MAMLVSWFPGNFHKYVKSDKDRRCELLKELCDDIKSAGHFECSERGIAAKINQICKEVELEFQGNHDQSECFKSYRIFMNFFGYVEVTKNTEMQGKTKWRRRQESHRRNHSRSLVRYPLHDNVARSSSDSDAETSNQSSQMEENSEDGDD
ncbi:hypothetical protein L914_15314 [Phytophthora nicotianae]|uniref:Uncharacterized protein n=3 Tax=Phytophthora nicotianae TaxID=4792 RepID=V9EIB3_PHYNI|nr:hypothetical protein F443_15901 [Phytophthora nicotianae P1569]ETM38362.1 hypothetical protein L914_15314 [Phytophthora nicotianae]ETO67073.1 hypothetical protein F444_15885 [Phytophthora nicotianae P1976]